MGFFDDVTSLVINNKEVQSIIASDGGIIYEKSNGYELTLTSDKSIIQTGESATLSATLTNNNVPMAGETIFFYDPNNPPISYSTDGSHDFTVNVGDAFKLYYTSQSTASNSYCAIRDATNNIAIYVHKEGNVSIIETNISRTTTFNSFSYLKLENGILSNGDGDTCDLSSYTLDFDLVRINNSGTVYVEDDLIGVGTTNQNGVATATYTGKGVGDINVQADWNNTVQSNTLTIEDCLYYDDATSDNSSNYTKTSGLSISHSTDHYILTASANNQMMELGSDYDNVRYEILMSGTSAFARGFYYSDTQNYYETNSIYSIYQNNWSINGIEIADITNGSWSAIKRTSYAMTNNTYYKFIIEKIGTSVTLKVETEDGTVIETQTVTKSLNSTHIGTLMYMGTAYVKDLKIKPL